MKIKVALVLLWPIFLSFEPAFADDAYLTEKFEVSLCRDKPSSESPGSEPCYWYVKSNRSKCNEQQPCKKLVVFFSGGEMGCDENFLEPAGYDHVLTRYADDDYVAVCAGIFVSSQADWATVPPYHLHAQRIDLLMKDISRVLRIETNKPHAPSQIWTGENLLFSGISHGATSPVIAMARTPYDNDISWNGTSKTAACFLDGTYNMRYTDAFWWTHRSSCERFRSRGMCLRYTGSTTGCETTFPLGFNSDMALDSPAVNAKASDFAIKDWKLIECGSLFPNVKCPALLFGDLFPKEPIEQMCARLQSPQNRSACQYVSLPYESHGTCSVRNPGIDHCRLWFNIKAR